MAIKVVYLCICVCFKNLERSKFWSANQFCRSYNRLRVLVCVCLCVCQRTTSNWSYSWTSYLWEHPAVQCSCWT